ncbi:hypothetical protein ACO2Q2_01745 [Dyella sp. KRB-257]|uniref:hypothetical protein n=1 Tax=Dyella sp. KRB-257 TaxID=3400915 RepID=UPI003C08363E
MKKLHILGTAIALATLTAGAIGAEHARPAPIAIHSVSVDLPVSTAQFPSGPGSELSGKCLICHSADMVLLQPKLSEAEWRSEIIKMRKVYGAPLLDSDIEPLTLYMTKVNASQPSD